MDGPMDRCWDGWIRWRRWATMDLTWGVSNVHVTDTQRYHNKGRPYTLTHFYTRLHTHTHTLRHTKHFPHSTTDVNRKYSIHNDLSFIIQVVGLLNVYFLVERSILINHNSLSTYASLFKRLRKVSFRLVKWQVDGKVIVETIKLHWRWTGLLLVY